VLALNPAVAETETPDAESALVLARAGDSKAFEEVYRAYATRLLRHAMALCGNPALAEELTQDTLVEAWKCLHRYNDRCQFFTWLCTILVNRYRNHLRKQRFIRFFAFGSTAQGEYNGRLEKLMDHGSSPDEAAVVREQAEVVRQCLQSLPAKQQQVVYLRFYVDNSLAGIAAALGCSEGTVKSRLFHALEKLRGMNALRAQFSNLNNEGRPNESVFKK